MVRTLKSYQTVAPPTINLIIVDVGIHWNSQNYKIVHTDLISNYTPQAIYVLMVNDPEIIPGSTPSPNGGC